MGDLGDSFKKKRGREGPLQVGRLYGGDFKNQQAIGDVVVNPATGAESGPYSHWGGESNDHISEMQRQHSAYLRGRGDSYHEEAERAEARAGVADKESTVEDRAESAPSVGRAFRSGKINGAKPKPGGMKVREPSNVIGERG